MDSFSRLGLAEPLAEALSSFGFAAPTPVQAETIPAILSRRDAIVESETGTGKTFAYLAPAMQLVSILERPNSGEPLAMVAAPTQELAVQIGKEAERLAKAAVLPAKTVVLLGGTPLEKQAIKLKSKPEIVVGTLGRLADLVALGRLRVSSLKILVLDEADRLFSHETEELAIALLKRAPAQTVRVLVSATIPERLRRGMRPLLRNALEISPAGVSVLSSDIEHWCFYCDGRKRLDFARRFEAAVRPKRCLVFMSMASRVEKSAAALVHLGLPVEAIHAGMDKESRRVALERFAKGEVRYLLTSDLGARGLDIAGISHVLSLDLPEEPTIYTHRAGRTARAGAKGVSIVLADGVELARASKIATKGGFVFRCKVLEEGKVFEPTSEEFFARVSAFEEQRMAAKAGRTGDGERRGAGSKKRYGEDRPSGQRRAGPYTAHREGGRSESPRREAPRREIEGPRTARRPDSAPWRPSAEKKPVSPQPVSPQKTQSILRKKSDEHTSDSRPRRDVKPSEPRRVEERKDRGGRDFRPKAKSGESSGARRRIEERGSPTSRRPGPPRPKRPPKS
jgi:ATP-dependent RNA helicase DeaD